MSLISSIAIFFAIVRNVFGAPDGDRKLRFSERRGPEDVGEYRTFGSRRNPYTESPSNIGDVFKIPIAVIRGSSAAAQALSPQNTQAIRSIFEIPVTTLDAVGSYIDESRTRRIANTINNNGKVESVGSTRPLSLSEQGRRERRDRLLKLKEEERQRRRITEEERLFHLGHHSSFNIFSSLADLLIGGGGSVASGHGYGGHGHSGHGNHHQWKPPKRPLKPSKPGGHHGAHGSGGHHSNGNGQYQVHEEVNEGYAPPLGIFSLLQQATQLEADENVIQNKIAPGSEFHYGRERSGFRFL